jgi:hypothetical protein
VARTSLGCSQSPSRWWFAPYLLTTLGSEGSVQHQSPPHFKCLFPVLIGVKHGGKADQEAEQHRLFESMTHVFISNFSQQESAAERSFCIRYLNCHKPNLFLAFSDSDITFPRPVEFFGSGIPNVVTYCAYAGCLIRDRPCSGD